MEALPFHVKGIVATGYFTGMRRREILMLTWEQVDLKKRLIKLYPENTKDSETRLIPICDELLNTLKSISKAIDAYHVFLYNGRRCRKIDDLFEKGWLKR